MLYLVTDQDKEKYQTYNDLWLDQYDQVGTSNSNIFGIHKSAGWLKQQFEMDNVAIIANVVASTNRRHDHSQLIMHTGDLQTDQYLLDRDGWGGRLLARLTGNSNVIAMSHDVGIFCNSENSGNRLDHAIHMRDSRNFSLPEVNQAEPLAPNSIMARALKAYYAKRGAEAEQDILQGRLAENWPYRRFFQHESTLRQFGSQIDSRLGTVMPVQPATLSRLYDEAGQGRLNNIHFGKQIASLYDSLLCADLLDMRSAYMEMSGWDTHRTEKAMLDKNLHDLFGINGGFDSLAQELVKIPGLVENLVFTFTSDFGRQLAANGTNGTDHGSGTYMIVMGVPVNGGTYGEMFPQREITPDPDQASQIPYEIQGAEIKGLTSYEHVLAEVCNWLEPGTGQQVFPNVADTQNPPMLENGVRLSTLFYNGHYISGKIDTPNGEAYNYTGMTVTATGVGTFKAVVPVDGSGVYRLGPLPNGNYTITPNKQNFVFSPVASRLSLLDANIDYANFTATPLLQIIYAVKHATLYTAEDGKQYRIMQAIGYNFVPDKTQLNIGSTSALVIIADGFLFALLPPSLSSGEIIIKTPSETYTHPVLFEDLEFV